MKSVQKFQSMLCGAFVLLVVLSACTSISSRLISDDPADRMEAAAKILALPAGKITASTKDRPALLAVLADPEPAIRLAAVKLLQTSNDDTIIPYLVEHFADTDSAVRILVIQTVTAFGETARSALNAATGHLLTALASGESQLRLAALQGLALGGNQETIPEIINLFDDPDSELAAGAMDAAASFGLVASPYLTKALSNEYPEIRIGVIEVLQRIDDKTLIGEILALLDDTDEGVRNRAVDLVAANCPGHLEDADPSVRKNCIKALGMVGLPVIGHTVKGLFDESPMVRAEAESALRSLLPDSTEAVLETVFRTLSYYPINESATAFLGSVKVPETLFVDIPEAVQRVWQLASKTWEPFLGLVEEDGIIYANSKSTVYALNAETGAALWEYKPPFEHYDKIRGLDFDQPLVVHRGMIYLTNENQRLYAIKASDTKLHWNFTSADLWGTCIKPYVTDTAIFSGVINYTGKAIVYALQPETGRVIWKRQFPDIGDFHLLIQDDYLFVAGQNAVLYAINPENGLILWESRTGAAAANPASANGLVVVTNTDNILSALRVTDGNLVWKAANIDGEPSIHDGIVYVSGSDDKYYALRADDGSPVWKVANEFANNTINSFADGLMYHFNHRAMTTALGSKKYPNSSAVNMETGAVLWSVNLDNLKGSSPFAAGRMVYLNIGDRIMAITTPDRLWSGIDSLGIDSLDLLVKLTENKNPAVVTHGKIALSQISQYGMADLAVLADFLGHENVLVRMNAVTALTAIGQPATPLLLEAANDDNAGIRRQILAYLEKSRTLVAADDPDCLTIGDAYFAEKNYLKALEYYTLYENQQADSYLRCARTYLALATGYSAVDNVKKAIGYFEQADALSQENLQLIANAFFTARDYVNAGTYYGQAGDAAGLLKTAENLYNNRDYTNAGQFYEQAGADPQKLIQVAESLFTKGDYLLAAAFYEKAGQLSTHAGAIAEKLLAKGDYGNAALYYEQSKPGPRPVVYERLANGFLKAGDTERAESYFLKADAYPSYYLELADAFASSGNTTKADYYKKLYRTFIFDEFGARINDDGSIVINLERLGKSALEKSKQAFLQGNNNLMDVYTTLGQLCSIRLQDDNYIWATALKSARLDTAVQKESGRRLLEKSLFTPMSKAIDNLLLDSMIKAGSGFLWSSVANNLVLYTRIYKANITHLLCRIQEVTKPELTADTIFIRDIGILEQNLATINGKIFRDGSFLVIQNNFTTREIGYLEECERRMKNLGKYLPAVTGESGTNG